MKFTVCAVYDTKAKAHLLPFFSTNIPVAIRAFAGAVNAAPGTGPVADNPSDFILFHIGFFDDVTAQFTQLGQPDNLGVGSQFRKEVFTPPDYAPRLNTAGPDVSTNEERN